MFLFKVKENEEMNYNFSTSSTKNVNAHLMDTRNIMVSEVDKMTKISTNLCIFFFKL